MKKLRLYLILISILLATLACNLPFNQPEEDFSKDNTESFSEESEQQPTPPPMPTSSTSDNQSEVFTTGGFSIMLPGSYEVSDDPADLPVLDSFIKVIGEWLGDSFEDVSAFAEQNIAILGYDTEDPNNLPTSFLMVENDQFSGIQIGVINVFVENLLKDVVDLTESETLQLGDRKVVRWLTSLNFQGQQSSQVIYLFKDSGKLWVIAFITEPSLLDSQLSIFDAATASLTLPGMD